MEKECARCGKNFQSKRETKKFCSETCKQYAYLIRHGLDIQRLRSVNNVIDGIVTTDNNTIKQAHINMEEKITFERPLIIKLIEDIMNNQHHLDSMIAHPYSYWDKDKALIVKWFNMRLKCILHNLIKLSYKEKVFPATLSALSEALVQMLRSNQYKFLSENYPYKFFIQQLAGKIIEITEQSINYGEIKLPLSLKRKAEFIVMLYNFSNLTPLRKFNELRFD
jgi:hypothetical protein